MWLPILKKKPLQKKSEIYVISYPKTGRTWLRVMIGKYLCEKNGLPEDKILQTEYVTVASHLPRTSFTHDGAAMKEGKSYKKLSSDKSFYKNKKVILLSRDLKDTLVSAYFQATRRIRVFSGSISDFVRNEQYGAIKVLTFYKYWNENKNVPKAFLFIRYEDMHERPEHVLEKTLRFLECGEIDREIIASSVIYSSFDNLRKAERENRFKTGIMSPKNIDDPDSFKIREGKIGNYKEHLNSDDIRYIDSLTDKLGCEFTCFEGKVSALEPSGLSDNL